MGRVKTYFLYVVVSFIVVCTLSLMLAGCRELDLKNFIRAKTTGLYVSITTGKNDNPGTKDEPIKDIQAAIDFIQLYNGTGKVHVAEGLYEVKYDEGSCIKMAEGVSLYGGYKLDFSTRNPEVYETIIRDTSTTGGTGEFEPNRAIEAGSGISSITLIDGFTVEGGGGERSSAIYCYNSSPTITNNTINGGTGSSRSFGIVNLSGSGSLYNRQRGNKRWEQYFCFNRNMER